MNIVPYGFAGDTPSRSFRLFVDGQSVPVVETPPMDAAERERLASEYRKREEYCHIYDTACMHLHAAHLAADGNVMLRIETNEPIQTWRVHPFRRNIQARVTGTSLTYSTGSPDPRYFIVRINQLPPLMIAIDPLETDCPVPGAADVIDASAFLADSADQTEGFQRAFAAVNQSKKTLFVPPGVYLTRQLHIHNGANFRIYLAPGCLVKTQPSRQGENDHRHGLWLQDCQDVSVFGRGGIDHQAYEHYALYGNDYQHGMVDYYTCNDRCPWITQSPLFITNSKRILIQDITIRNGRNFNINARNCDDLTLRRVKVFTPPASSPEYTDGLNIGSCRRVLVENCLVACNDDCFASGHDFATLDPRGASDHVVRGMLGWNMRANAIRLGFYSHFDQGDFVFENCDFVAMDDASILVHALRPQADGRTTRYGTIRLENCAFDDTPQLRDILIVDKAAIGSLELVNVRFYGKPTTGARFRIHGAPACPIGRLWLENITMDDQPALPPDPHLWEIHNVKRN